VIWGRFDPSFQLDEVAAFKRDVPDAETHILDAGHFALNDQPDRVAQLVADFLAKQPK
jgi:pimeloyl-ACP methyl ester carboxylesterase